MPKIVITSQLHLLLFQVSHYTQRVAEAKSMNERIFLKHDLYKFKQCLTAYLN